MRNWFRSTLAKLSIEALIVDVMILGGLGMVFYGLYQVQPWLAFTVTGAALVALGLRFTR